MFPFSYCFRRCNTDLLSDSVWLNFKNSRFTGSKNIFFIILASFKLRNIRRKRELRMQTWSLEPGGENRHLRGPIFRGNYRVIINYRSNACVNVRHLWTADKFLTWLHSSRFRAILDAIIFNSFEGKPTPFDSHKWKVVRLHKKRDN